MFVVLEPDFSLTDIMQKTRALQGYAVCKIICVYYY